jgi:hypothetical protein
MLLFHFLKKILVLVSGCYNVVVTDKLLLYIGLLWNNGVQYILFPQSSCSSLGDGPIKCADGQIDDTSTVQVCRFNFQSLIN